MDFGWCVGYSVSRRSTDMWKSERETVMALAIGVVALVLYGLVGTQDLAEEQRQAEETWAKPVVSETGVEEAWQ